MVIFFFIYSSTFVLLFTTDGQNETNLHVYSYYYYLYYYSLRPEVWGNAT